MVPDASMWTILMNTYGEAGQLQAAIGVFEEMQRAGLQPTNITYTSLMRW